MKAGLNARMLRGSEYAKDLRAIGQNLEELGLKAFDIKSEEKGYVVQGYREAFEPVELRFTAADIKLLDRQRQGMRSDPFRMPEFTNLSQLLRAIGDYLEHKDGRLLGISKQSGSVPLFTIQYETAQRLHKEEEYLASELYDLCLRMYKQRKSETTFKAH
jgi:hypothetical protein